LKLFDLGVKLDLTDFISLLILGTSETPILVFSFFTDAIELASSVGLNVSYAVKSTYG